MQQELRPLLDLFREPSWRSAVALVDIFLVAFVIYKLFSLIRGGRAWRVFAGIAIFVGLLFLSKALQLNGLYWLLEKATILGPVALVILLLPELRQAIEGFGRLGVWTQWLVIGHETPNNIQARTVEEIVAATAEMSASRIGALIVLERESKLEDVTMSGVALGAAVSAPLLVSIFYEGNPLHDGAVVIRGDAIAAAACRLPLSENRLDAILHMRHRAGVGVSEQFDCIVVIVSEERGTIRVALEGELQRLNSHDELRDLLNREWRHVKGEKSSERPRLFAKGRAR